MALERTKVANKSNKGNNQRMIGLIIGNALTNTGWLLVVVCVVCLFVFVVCVDLFLGLGHFVHLHLTTK